MYIVYYAALSAEKISNIIIPQNEVKPSHNDNERICDCSGDRDGKQKVSDTDIEQLNEFEDELQNIVYIK